MACNYEGLECHHIKGLNRPLLVIVGSKGVMGCGYLSVDALSSLGDAAAIFKGVNSFDDIMKADAKAVSEAGEKLGMKVCEESKEGFRQILS
jgi:uncharacterized protein YunC (DUF1805 family)